MAEFLALTTYRGQPSNIPIGAVIDDDFYDIAALEEGGAVLLDLSTLTVAQRAAVDLARERFETQQRIAGVVAAQTISLSPTTSTAIKVSWAYTGTTTTVNSTLASRADPNIVSASQATIVDKWTNAQGIVETPTWTTVYSRTATAALEKLYGFRCKVDSDKVEMRVTMGGVNVFEANMKDLKDFDLLNAGSYSPAGFIQSDLAGAPVFTIAPPAAWYVAGGSAMVVEMRTTTGTGAKTVSRGWSIRGQE